MLSDSRSRRHPPRWGWTISDHNTVKITTYGLLSHKPSSPLHLCEYILTLHNTIYFSFVISAYPNEILIKPIFILHFASCEPILIFVIDSFQWNPIKESLNPIHILQKITWCPTQTFIYLTFCIFWAIFNFCHWYFFIKPNQRKLEIHPYIAENHMMPSPNLHLCSTTHLFNIFSAIKPTFCIPGWSRLYR